MFHKHFSVLNILKTHIMATLFVCAHVCTCVFASIFYVLPTTWPFFWLTFSRNKQKGPKAGKTGVGSDLLSRHWRPISLTTHIISCILLGRMAEISEAEASGCSLPTWEQKSAGRCRQKAGVHTHSEKGPSFYHRKTNIKSGRSNNSKFDLFQVLQLYQLAQ